MYRHQAIAPFSLYNSQVYIPAGWLLPTSDAILFTSRAFSRTRIKHRRTALCFSWGLPLPIMSGTSKTSHFYKKWQIMKNKHKKSSIPHPNTWTLDFQPCKAKNIGMGYGTLVGLDAIPINIPIHFVEMIFIICYTTASKDFTTN